MAETFSFDHLTPTEFENFCYDLLGELGFVNLDWRKGTGYDTSPADDGRDIECEWEIEDIDGSKRLEKWFVDSKRYKEGIPVSAIRNILDWATAERPSTVLIIASNFLSNPAKRFLENYQENNKPAFDIKYWEKPDLERLTLNKWNLLKKFKVPNINFPFLNLMHPAHLWYMRDPPMNSLDYLFNLIENIDGGKRDEIFSFAYLAIINPRSREPTFDEGETMGDLRIDDVDYDAFKTKTQRLASILFEQFLITSIIQFTLENIFNLSDMTEMNHVIKKQEKFIEELEKIKSGEVDPEFNKLFTRDKIQENCDRIIESTKKRIQDMPKNYEKRYELYIYFCDKIVSELFQEPILDVLYKKRN